MRKKQISFMTTSALMAAVMCIICPMMVPVGAVPVSLATFAVALASTLLGTGRAIASCVIYLLLGLAGMPVFTGFQGGIAKLAGPTGGYLVGFLPMILIGGCIGKNAATRGKIAGLLLGQLVDYALGTGWYMLQTGNHLHPALTICVYPFLVPDVGKIALGVLLGQRVRKELHRAGMQIE